MNNNYRNISVLMCLFLFLINILACNETVPETRYDSSHISPDILELGNKAASYNYDALEKLMKILKDDTSSSRRSQAAMVIGDKKIKSANRTLLSGLERDEDIVRQEIILALGKLRINANYYVILRIWKNKSESEAIRLKALESLGYFNEDEAVRILINMIRMNDSTFSETANLALRNSKSPRAARLLIEILKDDDTNVSIAKTVVQLKQKAIYTDIIFILNVKFRKKSYDAVFEILTNFLCNEEYRSALDIFIKAYLLAPDDFSELKKKLIRYLKKIGINRSYVVAAVGDVNLRAQPNTRSEILGIFEVGYIASVIKKSRTKYSFNGVEDYWYKVKTELGKEGWLFGGYLKKLNHENLGNAN